jgi:hypothetical protein
MPGGMVEPIETGQQSSFTLGSMDWSDLSLCVLNEPTEDRLIDDSLHGPRDVNGHDISPKKG